MTIAVLGLGGVGGYIGAKLCSLKDEHEIIFLSRGEHLKAIQDNGLRIIDIDKEEIYHPTYALQSTDKHLDIVFLCTKTYHSKQALLEHEGVISKDTLIIPVANGVNSKEELQQLTTAKITDACVYIVSHKLSPGTIKKATNVFALRLSDDVEDILEPLLTKAGLRTKFSTDVKQELWKKFLFISAMGSLTSYYEVGMGTVYKEHKKELEEILYEIYSISQALGVNLEEKELAKAVETSSKLPDNAPTSMWLDMQKKGLNELETLSGYIVKQGQRYQIQTPIMQKIYDKLK